MPATAPGQEVPSRPTAAGNRIPATILEQIPPKVRALQPATAAALRQAVSLYSQPRLASSLRHAPLPDADWALLLQCAAGAPALSDVADTMQLPALALRQALDFYLEQVLFAPGGDARRVLGLRDTSDGDALRTHVRLLRTWLTRADRNDPLGNLRLVQVQRTERALHHRRRPATRQSAVRPRSAADDALIASIVPSRALVLALISLLLAGGLLWLSHV